MEKEIRRSSSNRREESFSSTLSSNLNNRHEVSQGDKDVLSSIESFYFESHVDSEAACQSYIIGKLPQPLGDQPLDLDYIISEKNRLKKQLSVVTKKVTDVMMIHQGTYFAELQKVVHLQTLLNDAINTCIFARRQLAVSKQGLTMTPLKAVNDVMLRNSLQYLLKQIEERKNSLPEESIEDATQTQDSKSETSPCKGMVSSSNPTTPEKRFPPHPEESGSPESSGRMSTNK